MEKADPKSGYNALMTEDVVPPRWGPEYEYIDILEYANTLIISLKRTIEHVEGWKREAMEAGQLVENCENQFLKVAAIPKETLGGWNCKIPLPPYYCKIPESYVQSIEKVLDKWQTTWEKFKWKLPRYRDY